MIAEVILPKATLESSDKDKSGGDVTKGYDEAKGGESAHRFLRIDDVIF